MLLVLSTPLLRSYRTPGAIIRTSLSFTKPAPCTVFCYNCMSSVICYHSVNNNLAAVSTKYISIYLICTIDYLVCSSLQQRTYKEIQLFAAPNIHRAVYFRSRQV